MKGTKTEKNLRAAVRAEGLAYVKYAAFAKVAETEGYEYVAAAFRKTAENESVHADIWMREIGGVSLDTRENLIAAADAERYEWNVMYERFAAEAEEEGFTDIAEKLRGVARIESAHEQRYRELAANIDLMQSFSKPKEVLWECANCGNVAASDCAPEVCPVCGASQGFFEKRNDNFR